MEEFPVVLGTNDVKNFVNIVTRYDCPINLVSGRYVVDAKSIMGIFSLDLTKPILVRIEGAPHPQLLEDLAPYRQG